MDEELRTCKKCGNIRSLEYFHSYKRMGDRRYSYECLDCRSEYMKKYRQDNRERLSKIQSDYYNANRDAILKANSDWRRNNPEKFKKYRRKWREKNPEYDSEYKKNNRDRINYLHARYRESNREKLLEYNREYRKDWNKRNPNYQSNYEKYWRKANPDKSAAKIARRAASKIQATPEWLTSEHHAKISEFYTHARDCYLVTGEKYHVDHIVPLKGYNVCGLHVPWNLQVLPADVNISKSNKFPY